MNNQKRWLLYGFLALACPALHPFASTNFFTPDDPDHRLTWWEDSNYRDTRYRGGVAVEYGETSHGRNWDADRVNILQLWSCDQATIPMLMNNPCSPKSAQLLHDLDASLPGQADDDGILGHVRMTGKFHQLDATVAVEFGMPFNSDWGNFSLFVGLPIRWVRVDDIAFTAVRRAGNPMDIPFFERVNGPTVLPGLVKSLGGAELSCWDKVGVGDLVAQVRWQKSFSRCRDNLKRVDLFMRAGFSAPTGECRDEDAAFSIPLGNDGAWGFPLGAGLALSFNEYARIGVDADFLILLEKTRLRRIKTEIHQTEFLLLTKARVTKDHGLVWKLHAFAQGYHLWNGLSLTVAYQYIKHEEDTLTPCGNKVDTVVMNTSRALEEKNVHQLVFRMNYDFRCDDRAANCYPHLSLFYKLPIAGRNMIEPETFGGQIAFTF